MQPAQTTDDTPTLRPGDPYPVNEFTEIFLSSLGGVYVTLPRVKQRAPGEVFTAFTVKQLVMERSVVSEGDMLGPPAILNFCGVCKSVYYTPSPEKQPTTCADHPEQHWPIEEYFLEYGLKLTFSS